MQLVVRRGIWYAKGKIHGVLYRVSTGFREALGHRGRQAALRRLNEIELAIRSGAHGWSPSTTPTMRDFWTQTYEPTYTTRKTRPERDKQMMAHALPFFGDMALDAITQSDCERYLNIRRASPQANPRRKTFSQLAEGTVQRERAFLHAVLQKAVDDGIIDRNPWRGVESKEYAVRDRLVTDEEQAILLSRLSKRFQRFVLFLLGTGIRLEECRGINPGTDIDLQARLLRVTGKFKKTRTVPIPAELVTVIREQLRDEGGLWTQTQQRLREVLATACRAVEPSPAGTRPQWARKAQAGIPLIRPHDLRHTFGWRWLRGGGDIYALSRILGHAGVAVTERHYAKLLKEDLRAKADAVELGLGLPKPEADGKVIPWRKGRAARDRKKARFGPSVSEPHKRLRKTR